MKNLVVLLFLVIAGIGCGDKVVEKIVFKDAPKSKLVLRDSISEKVRITNEGVLIINGNVVSDSLLADGVLFMADHMENANKVFAVPINDKIELAPFNYILNKRVNDVIRVVPTSDTTGRYLPVSVDSFDLFYNAFDVSIRAWVLTDEKPNKIEPEMNPLE